MALGCQPGSVYTTYGSTMPIMLGPVRTLRKHAPHGVAVHEFETEVVNVRAVASSSTQHGGYVTTTTTTSFQAEDATKFDAAMLQASAQHPTCSVRTQRLQVGAYFFYGLVAIVDKSWAAAVTTVHGVVEGHLARAGRQRRRVPGALQGLHPRPALQDTLGDEQR